MFKFLFGNKASAPEIKRETQRETLVRAQREINEILATLSPKPKITLYPEEGTLTIALALPYFFRSTTRLSRVRKPAAFKAPRSAGS